ncbi:MAG: hemerythrin family protein [Sulfurisoma sp.]|nr:hemerythrin family protein [Sulfurisoma sp.]
MLSWDTELHGLGIADMDATHEEFAHLATEVARAGDDDFPLLFAMLLDHTRRHFENESRLMRECHFPATGEHEAEHWRILADLTHMQRAIDEGRLGLARLYARQGLPDWFRNHLATMDSALAARLKRQAMPSPAAGRPYRPSARVP